MSKLEDVKHMLLLGDYPPQHWVSDIIADYEQLQKDKAELVEALKPFAKFACSPEGECDCHNCTAKSIINSIGEDDEQR